MLTNYLLVHGGLATIIPRCYIDSRIRLRVIHSSDYAFQVDEDSTTQTKLFTFSVVFEPEATQEDVFEYCGVKRLCDAALDG